MPVENSKNGRRRPLKRGPPFLLLFTAHLLHHCPSRKFNLTCDGLVWITLQFPAPSLFVCLCGSRPSSSKHSPATSRPISVPLAVNSRLYIYPITLMLPANSDDAIRQLAGEKRFCLSLAARPLAPPAHSFPTIDAGALHYSRQSTALVGCVVAAFH